MTAEETDDFQRLLNYLKALADQSRLRILGLVAQQERSVEELAALLELRGPTVSHHLATLKALDLVSMRTEGNTHLYRLNVKGLERVSKLLSAPGRVVAQAAAGTAGADDAWERRVLRDFFDGEHLKAIPSSRKKREVIVKWLAEQFETGRTYSEADVNELIRRYHPDSATLRRELLAFHLMRRERGVWWRTQGE